MTILLKSFFMNGWSQGGVTPTQKTWLQANKAQEDWQNSQGNASGFLSPSGQNPGFLTDSKPNENWLNTEDGTPDFSEEGEEKYI